MTRSILVAAVFTMAAFGQQQAALDRLSEEAEVFAREAPKLFAEEKLVQKALKGPPRFRPRADAGAPPPGPQMVTREIISEYTFAALKESPDRIREMRKAVSIDGKQLRTAQQARETLTLDLKSDDDKVKKKILQDFEKLGLRGAAVDFGQIILIFRRRSIPRYTFTPAGTERIGADTAMILNYEQKQDGSSLTIFEGRQVFHVKLAGKIWLRMPDYLPLRVTLETSQPEAKDLLQKATVDYAPSSHGILVPVSIVHRQTRADVVEVENIFTYSAFRKFSASAEIKFTEASKN